MKYLQFKTFYKLIVLFIIFLLVEGFIHHYYFILSQSLEFLPVSDQTGYNNIIWAENGLVEQLQIIFLSISIFLLIKFFKFNSNNFHIYTSLIILLYLTGVIYYFLKRFHGDNTFLVGQRLNFFQKLIIKMKQICTIHQAYLMNCLEIFY